MKGTMSWHPRDDDLTLLHYGELPAPADVEVRGHLAACPSCAARWAACQETLALADRMPVPEPPSDFDEVIWSRIERALATPVGPSRRWALRHVVPIGAWAAAVAALVALGVAGTWGPAPTGPPTRRLAAHDANARRERVLLTALDDHFAQTEVLLVELLNAPSRAADTFVFERTTADDSVASGRLYRATARETGETQLAATLDDLEGVLVEVARSRETPSRAEVADWRQRIESDDLLFKVRAVTNDIHDRQARPATAN